MCEAVGPERAPKAEVNGEVVSAEYIELYKLAVEMADRVSVRRGIANSFFLTINTGIVAVLASQHVRWYLPVAGIVFAVAWLTLLRSYRDLNSAKFKVILALEEQLPARIYGEEWKVLRRESVRFGLRRQELRAWLSQYQELGRAERVVPCVFVLIYLAELMRQLVG